MSARSDYVPRRDAEFSNWFKNIVDYVAERTGDVINQVKWEYIPVSTVDELAAAYDDWIKHYEPTLTPHTPAITTEKNNARARSESVIRTFVQRFLHWPPVTDGDRVNMGIPNRDNIRTPHIEVTEIVEFELILRNIREVVVDFWVKGGTGKAKPARHDGAVIVWDVLDTPPERPESLNRHTMASRTPKSLLFDETERGKTVYIAAAWQNNRGNLGQFSEILSGIIP
ncbi:MAG: hypothetical protein LBU70_04020 [Chitinispirillales bacterium]|jgi:hypothetical protein|nr:hypothetical protein [Chitinispirillales bacterium]